MSGQPMRSGAILGLSLATAVALGACGADAQPMAPEVSTAQVEDQALLAILDAAIQDEYHAEAVYQGVLGDFGPVRPFSNIIGAEVRHAAAIATLYTRRDRKSVV